ncbi:MAG TPA: hypothetical protein VGD01_17205 [Candidatus Elarobacter sp.]
MELVVEAFLGGLAAVIAMQLLAGGINTRHLFYGRRNDGALYFSPERVQLLLFTVWVAFSYLLSVIEQPGKFPEISAQTLGLLGGSHALYLGGKTVARLAPTRKDA